MHKKNCATCPMRKKNNSAMVRANAVKAKPAKVCMGCFKSGKHHGCEKKKLGKHNTANERNIRY